MRWNRVFVFAALASITILPSILWAGDAATLHVIGSSADGRYLAYEQYGYWDGSGSPYSIVEVIDLEKSLPAQETLREGRGEGESRDLATVRRDALANATLSKWKIDSSRTGTPLVQHLLTEIQADGNTVSFSTYPIIDGYRPDEYSIRLEKYRVDKECSFWDHSYGAKLALYNWKNGTVQNWGKQVEPSGPRTCAMDYRIQEVRLVSGELDHLLVFLSVYRAGFEGFDVRYMVVSGTFRETEAR
jgi:predicted secreted protein